jgi:hypothetical protein
VCRIAAIIRKPAFWLALLLLVAWGWSFRREASPAPRFVVHTGGVYSPASWSFSPSSWAYLEDLSDDGQQFIVGIYHGRAFRGCSRRLQLWHAPTGTNQTPPLWDDEDWRNLLSAPRWNDNGMMDLLLCQKGKEFLHDAATWAALRQRLTIARAQALDDLRKTVRAVEDSEAPSLFPRRCYFSPDGRRFAYVARNGWPLYVVSDSLGDGTAIEDMRTGKRVAFLAGVTSRIHIARDNQTAVSVNDEAAGKGEQPRLFLWDLATSTRRAKLMLPEVSNPFRVKYSADGRYVFAHYLTWSDLSSGFRWWDVTTGQQVGEVVNPGDSTFTDGGRTLVTHPSATKGNAASESYLLCFWDVATGASLGDWDLGGPAERTGMIHALAGSEGGRYLAAKFDPDYGRNA